MTHQRPEWNESFMLAAILAGTRSSCLKRPVGAALVIDNRIVASGYNGAPQDVATCLNKGFCYYESLACEDSKKGLGSFASLREERKLFCMAVHAEQNVLNQCLRIGTIPCGGTLFVTNFPCPICAKNIIQAKIKKIVVWKEYLRNKLLTEDEYEVSSSLFKQAGIQVSNMAFTKKRIKQICSMILSVGERTSYKFKP